jgi:CheY-like chemotaxis protein
MMKQPASVLVVDDNQDVLQSFSLILRHCGYEVETAGDGLAAVDRTTERPFDVVLMDVNMPGLDGMSAFRRIKDLHPDAKVIMMTAYYDDLAMREALEWGAFGALRKPVDIKQVMTLISLAVSGPAVIIVDDDAAMGDSMAKVLQVEGYQAFAVTSGVAAVRLMRDRAFRVAFIDWKMPDMDGIETAARLKELNPRIDNVIMTAHRKEADSLLARDVAGAVRTCVYKPFPPSELVELLGGLVNCRAQGEPDERAGTYPDR